MTDQHETSEGFSHHLTETLISKGFTHCFYLAGGNSMHLLEAARQSFSCVPFVHEVSAVMAAENFNIASKGKAWVLVTAGPGITNCITGIAGAWLESHAVLVVGAQVKTSDIGVDSGFRQVGIQEIDGVAATRPFCKDSIRLTRDTSCSDIENLIDLATDARPGPVFLEVPIDLSAAPVVCEGHEKKKTELREAADSLTKLGDEAVKVIDALQKSSRPLFLVGQGCTKSDAIRLAETLLKKSIPIATSWSGADRVGNDFPNYAGRPNYFGMRSSNLIIQKCDLLVSVGARLGLQQTGFNLDEFAPHAKCISVDVDSMEMTRGPKRTLAINSDSGEFLNAFLPKLANSKLKTYSSWLSHCTEVRKRFPNDLTGTDHFSHGVNPYALIETVSELCDEDELLVSCSSGGTFTAFMQTFRNQSRQRIFSNKGLASMGYGLASAIGVAIAHPDRRVLLFEGDGGFAQNLQELGTVSKQNLSIKILLFDNDGYASIKSSQRRFFGGKYVGCDSATGLGMPNWELLAEAFGIGFVSMPISGWRDSLEGALVSEGPTLIRIPVDPEFEYAPKILSTVSEDGAITSNPLHVMHPEIIGADLLALAGKYLEN